MLKRCDLLLTTPIKITASPLRGGGVDITARRRLTQQQASVALRPFYSVVHPDRFVRNHEARHSNEKSLQVFNGYLNELYQNSSAGNGQLKPVNVTFAIPQTKGSDQLENVLIELFGADPARIVRTALERCRLSTDHLLKVSKSNNNNNDNNSFTAANSSTENYGKSAHDLWHELHEHKARKKRAAARHLSTDLLANVEKCKEAAVGRMENFDRIRESLNDEIDYIIRKSGVKEIIWAINWEQSYMRRCLTNIKDMIFKADEKVRRMITMSLYDRTLVFGRGSFVCCDGSLQFGADDATGAWQKICLEANVRRFQVNNLRRLVDRVGELFGGAELVVNPLGNLVATTEQMQSIIVRVSSRNSHEREEIRRLGCETIVEIVSAYGELAVLQDGRLQIPCNVDGQSLLTFLHAHSAESLAINRAQCAEKNCLADTSEHCRRTLNLHSLSWDDALSHAVVIETLKRLCRADRVVQDALRGLALHISTNSEIYVMSNGRIAIPPEWM